MQLSHKMTKPVFSVVVSIMLVLNASIFLLNGNNHSFYYPEYSEEIHAYYDPNQYAYLADAFLHGELALNLPVPGDLIAMENPYSFQDRYEIADESTGLLWDYCYYDGKLYCYYGALPAILLYVPYQLATGQYLPTPCAIVITASLAIIALGLLTWRIARRYFSQTATLGTLLVAFLTLYLAANLSYLTMFARFYSLPFLFSIFFTCLGLWFWLGTRRLDSGEIDLWSDDSPKSSSVHLSTAHIALGSLCIALNIGCRPQFFLFALLAFFIFRKEIFQERMLFSRAGINQTVAALAPFLLAGGLQMAYNYARFGSLFDFGSHKNLTAFDMQDYYQSRALTLIYFAFYLFHPLVLTDEFPFISTVDTSFPSLGWAPNEPFFGGIFMLVPALFLVFGLPFVWKVLRKRGIGWGLVFCVFLSLGVLVLDIRVAGITERYFSDFAIYLGLVAIFVLFALWERLHESPKARRIFLTALWILTIFAVCVAALRLFSPLRFESIAGSNPELWAQICTIVGM